MMKHIRQLTVAFILSLLTFVAHAAANFVHVNAIDGAADASGTTVAPSALNVGSGRLLVVGVRWESGGLNDAATATISDTAGNTYTNIGYSTTGNATENQKVGLWYCLSSTASASNIVTATLSAAREYKAIFVVQYSYTGTIELGATGSGSSSTNVTAQTTSPSLSAVAGDLVAGWFANYNSGPPTFTADSPFTIRSSSIYARYLEYIVVTGGSFAPSITADGSGDTYAALSAVFQEDTGGSPATLSSATPSGTLGTSTTATLGATTDQSSGTIYGVVDTAGNISSITATQIKAGQNNASASAVAACNATVSTTSPSCGVTGLTAGTSYSYAEVQNNANGDSNVVTGTFTTAAGGTASIPAIYRHLRQQKQ